MRLVDTFDSITFDFRNDKIGIKFCSGHSSEIPMNAGDSEYFDEVIEDFRADLLMEIVENNRHKKEKT